MAKRILMITKRNIISEGVANRIAADPSLKLAGWVMEEDMAQGAYESCAPDCVILGGAFFPQDVGLKIRKFILKNPYANIVVVSNKIDKQFVDEVLSAGAKGIICPAISSLDRLIEAIHMIGNDAATIYQDSSTEALHTWGKLTEQDRFMSDREREIIKFIAEGWSSKEIAKTLTISPATVDVHRRNIMKKLGAKKATEITKYAIRSSILVL